MRTTFRVLLVLYALFLIACVVVFATDNSTGGPYNGMGKAMASIAAGLPWTLLALVLDRPGFGPKVLYVFACIAALVNLLILAHFAGWRIVRRT
jgi:tryptophan-rich sensory protein